MIEVRLSVTVSVVAPFTAASVAAIVLCPGRPPGGTPPGTAVAKPALLMVTIFVEEELQETVEVMSFVVPSL